jgi:hypothetical protein
MVFGPIDYALMGVGTMLTLVLLGAGISTIMRKPVGRALHLVYALLAFPLTAANVWNTLQKSGAMAQWVKDYPNNKIAQSQASGGSQIGELIGLAVLLVMGLAWPVFCLIWFGLVKRSTAEMTAGLENPAA